MSKVMAEIMKGHISNECRFRLGRRRFELFEPLVDGGLPKSPAIEFSFRNRDRFPLRSEHIVTISCSFTPLEILVEWLSCCIQEDNVPILLTFMPHMKFANFPSHLGMLHQQVGNIAHATSSPLAQSKHRFATQVS